MQRCPGSEWGKKTAVDAGIYWLHCWVRISTEHIIQITITLPRTIINLVTLVRNLYTTTTDVTEDSSNYVR